MGDDAAWRRRSLHENRVISRSVFVRALGHRSSLHGQIDFFLWNDNVCKNFLLKYIRIFPGWIKTADRHKSRRRLHPHTFRSDAGFSGRRRDTLYHKIRFPGELGIPPCSHRSHDQCSQLGFYCKQFLLMETSSQVWYFILQYLDTVATRNLSLVECLNFLFQLSFAKFGKVYFLKSK